MLEVKLAELATALKGNTESLDNLAQVVNHLAGIILCQNERISSLELSSKTPLRAALDDDGHPIIPLQPAPEQAQEPEQDIPLDVTPENSSAELPADLKEQEPAQITEQDFKDRCTAFARKHGKDAIREIFQTFGKKVISDFTADEYQSVLAKVES
jgi:hypothetical protein